MNSEQLILEDFKAGDSVIILNPENIRIEDFIETHGTGPHVIESVENVKAEKTCPILLGDLQNCKHAQTCRILAYQKKGYWQYITINGIEVNGKYFKKAY